MKYFCSSTSVRLGNREGSGNWFRLWIIFFDKCTQWLQQQNQKNIFVTRIESLFIATYWKAARIKESILVTLERHSTASQRTVLFSSIKQPAPVLCPTSYFSMPVSNFTPTLSRACLEQSWAKFSVPSSVTPQRSGSVHIWRALFTVTSMEMYEKCFWYTFCRRKDRDFKDFKIAQKLWANVGR